MTLSQLALEDVEALYLGPSFLMADPMGPLLDQDEEEALSPSSSLEGKAPASPPLSFSSYASSLSPYQTLSSSPLSSASPPPSPPPTQPSSFLGTKAGANSLSLHWLVASDLLDTQVGADDCKDDAFAGMDWMSEKIDLSEFDLDSLIGSCSSDESPNSPEDLLASLDSHMDLDLDSFDTTIPTPHDTLELGLSLPSIPALPLELPLPGAAEAKKTEVAFDQEVMKSEPPSLAPSPSPPSPAYTLELGSEVDVLDAEKMATSLTATIIPDPSGSIQTTSPIVLSLPTAGHIVVVLTNEDEPSLVSLPDQSITISPPSSDCDSDSGIESVPDSPARLPSHSPTVGSSRTKPYSKPEPSAISSPSAKTSRVKSVSGAPKVVEKKLKKMEQNKTAATRYRQKKRVEQELLSTELEQLEVRNHELTEKAESISREIQYLKDLMEEVRKHRRGKTSSVA
ncbi:cyclic AMP-dependent transcription factor ATF-4 [Siniperca chuatsi]|uniref:cyclic AMP-dependent transcription factor ATF-4 n=1 Tax=Siniperca chuatsi TaxID=119488 RepID=UPI001CE1CD09|nr:cyclic AMP-dependent transcription factor ATF-4 [Siniperca chuatsi]XP_044042937.1 cyclic AMP-dependent transcription factor ATF-4 [Siniperca chuatsi]